MFTMKATAETSADPDAVIAAALDFTDRRADVWPNVKAGHFEVHASGETFTEATEYLWPLGFYERCRYERPRPDQVRATVLESNVVAPGSTWELTVAPIANGTRVEMVYRRAFPLTVRGRIAWLLNHAGARIGPASDLRHALAEIEQRTA